MEIIDLYRWRWHHFRPFNAQDNYLSVLRVFGQFDGEPIADIRSDVGKATGDLKLDVALGQRVGDPYPDPLRDRFDVWRFTGAVFEPALVDARLVLTPLGRALVAGQADFQDAMHRQALRLRFPLFQLRSSADIEATEDALDVALESGDGVNVVEVISEASKALIDRGLSGEIDGEEALRFFTGMPGFDALGERVDALARHRIGEPQPMPEINEHHRRQGRELFAWLGSNGALPLPGEDPPGPVFEDQFFTFNGSSLSELRRWDEWWGSWPDELTGHDPVQGTDVLPVDGPGPPGPAEEPLPKEPVLSIAGPTDIPVDAKGRAEQGALRRALFSGKEIDSCAMCGRELPVEMLVTAHIKERKDCSHQERLDISNVMPVCVLGCDGLFERGHVYVDGEGTIQSGVRPAVTADLEAARQAIVGLTCGAFREANASYFAEHRKRVGV